MSFRPRIVFAGTPDFAVPALEALSSSGADIVQVLTQPDRPAGRGRRLVPSAVKKVSDARGLPLQQPSRLRDAAILSDWASSPDLLVVVAYGLLLPEWLLDWPQHGAINIHASLLPRWRGAAPIQRAILEGDEVSGVSIMQVERALDAGPVFSQRSVDIGRDETAGVLHDRLAQLGAELLMETLPGIMNGELRAVPQDDSAASYAAKIKKSDAIVDWRDSAESLARGARAFNPWPISFATLSDGRTLRIHSAQPLRGSAPSAPGEIISTSKQGIDVATGDGVLRLLEIQPPAAKVMSAAAYLNAHSLAGVRFVE